MALGYSIVCYPDTTTRQSNATSMSAIRMSSGNDYVVAYRTNVTYDGIYSGGAFKINTLATAQAVYDASDESTFTTIFERDSDGNSSVQDWVAGPTGIWLASANDNTPTCEFWHYPYTGGGWTKIGDWGHGTGLHYSGEYGSMFGGMQYDPASDKLYAISTTASGSNNSNKGFYEVDTSTGAFTSLASLYTGMRFGYTSLSVDGQLWTNTYRSTSFKVRAAVWDGSTLTTWESAANDTHSRGFFPVPEGGVSEIIGNTLTTQTPRSFTLSGGSIVQGTYPDLKGGTGAVFWEPYYTWDFVVPFLGPDPTRFNLTFNPVVTWATGKRAYFSNRSYPDDGAGSYNTGNMSLYELTGFATKGWQVGTIGFA